jgi:N-acetyl-gamma-glutamyl-phosphate reductase
VYGLGLKHKHVPEIRQYADLTFPPVFVPAYGAFRQGIVMCIPLQQGLLPAGVDAESVHACLVRHYADAPRVRVLALGSASDPDYLNLMLTGCAV